MKDQPYRKSNRLPDYDYSQSGTYFITICVKDRLPLLAHHRGDATLGDPIPAHHRGDAALGDPIPAHHYVGDAALGIPILALTQIGEMVKRHIEKINVIYENIDLDNYVIMPNHLHLLITVKSGTPRAASPTKALIPKVVNALKSLTSKEYKETLWQRGYYDHIVRCDEDYQVKWNYIETNPLRWTEDEYCSHA